MGRRTDRRGQWLKGVLDLCILGLLQQGEAYGYEIGQQLAGAGMGEIKGGTLYPALSKLENDDLVTASWRSSDAGPRRKYYTLTGAGWQYLADERDRWLTFADTAQRLLEATGDPLKTSKP